jgi:hypothetical protein
MSMVNNYIKISTHAARLTDALTASAVGSRAKPKSGIEEDHAHSVPRTHSWVFAFDSSSVASLDTARHLSAQVEHDLCALRLKPQLCVFRSVAGLDLPVVAT